jgi:hypothetical protein
MGDGVFHEFVLMTNLIMLIILQQWEALTSNPQNVPFKAEASSFEQAWGKYSAKYKGTRADYCNFIRIMYDLGAVLVSTLRRCRGRSLRWVLPAK